MKFFILLGGMAAACAVALSYFYDQLAIRRAARKEDRELIARLAALPPVKVDFSTPEGAVLCFEQACRQKNFEAAAACRDFAAEARFWLLERGHLSRQQKEEMLPETIGAMEKSFRDGWAKSPAMDWSKIKTYFQAREPFGDVGVVVNKITQMPDGNLVAQRMLVTETSGGWKIVKALPN